jgi:hypothetical protein
MGFFIPPGGKKRTFPRNGGFRLGNFDPAKARFRENSPGKNSFRGNFPGKVSPTAATTYGALPGKRVAAKVFWLC